MNELLLTGLATTTIALAVPLIIAALGEVVVEKSGVINVGIEGMMLTGAFAGYVAASQSHSAIVGLLAALVSGAALACVFAVSVLVFLADQIVVGTAINILALGITGVLYRALQSSLPPLHAVGAHTQDALGWFAFLMAPVCAWFLMRTRHGLALRAAGEHPQAAATAGWSVRRIRLAALLFGGAMAGAAGAYLSIAYTSGFGQGMSGGKGFIALAVVIIGRWSPVGVLLGALLFGAASAAQYGFQASNTHIPYQLFLALPYLLTLAALVIRSGRVSAPAALGSVSA